MKRRRLSSFLCGITGVAILLAFVIIQPASALSQQANLQQTLQMYADNFHQAGVSGSVVQMHEDMKGSTSARAGTQERHSNAPVPWQSHFRTGSTTKTFVATVILQLVAEGKMSLDNSVERWLPGLLNRNGYDGSQITIRQLLNHTSGIFDYTTDEDFFATLDTPEHYYANRFKTYTPHDLINIGISHPPLFNPGTGWEYSSTNYIIAGEVIKAVTGNSWDKEVRSRILIPLGLSDTKSAGTNPYMPWPFTTAYHIYTENPQARQYTNTTTHNLSWGGAAGDIITSTRDENRFFRALMKGYLLPPAQLAEMKTTIPVDDTFSYGLGLMWMPSPCDARGIWGHDGGTVGYATTNGVTDDGARSIVASLATTTFTDINFLNATFPLRTGVVVDGLCHGQPSSDSAKNFSAPSVSSKRNQIKF